MSEPTTIDVVAHAIESDYEERRIFCPHANLGAGERMGFIVQFAERVLLLDVSTHDERGPQIIVKAFGPDGKGSIIDRLELPDDSLLLTLRDDRSFD